MVARLALAQSYLWLFDRHRVRARVCEDWMVAAVLVRFGILSPHVLPIQGYGLCDTCTVVEGPEQRLSVPAGGTLSLGGRVAAYATHHTIVDASGSMKE